MHITTSTLNSAGVYCGVSMSSVDIIFSAALHGRLST